MKTVTLPCGERVPSIGLGTWRMGENPKLRAQEIAALRLGLEEGATLIDTAEMYGDGQAEELVAEAIVGRRDDVFLVSKVYPHNATHEGTQAACERSLRRLKTDRLDLYLLHWRGNVPLNETLNAFAALQQAGKIRYYGVSNFDVGDLKQLWAVPEGREIQTNQVLYNIARRGVEWDLLPWLRERRIATMAYSPIEQGRLLRKRGLVDFTKRYGITPAQTALAWLLRHDDVIVIPKTSHPDRVHENLAARNIHFTAEQLDQLEAIFPSPDGPRPLEMI
jgi:diketogulonate reductase-like aldo/keto reductase